MSRLRPGTSWLFPATLGFLTGMAVMAVIALLFRPTEPERSRSATDAIPAASAPVPLPEAVARVDAGPPAPPPPASPPVLDSRPLLTDTSTASLPAAPSTTTPDTDDDAIGDLRQRRFEVPVEGITRSDLQNTFADARGERRHEALDVLAPRNTPVVAVEDGTIAKLFFSKAGGITVYQFDPSGQYAYYYAHLERYADGLTEGAAVKRGQVLGYVGTTGNAPADTPHLHFAIFKLTSEKHWWQGAPIDPFPVLR